MFFPVSLCCASGISVITVCPIVTIELGGRAGWLFVENVYGALGVLFEIDSSGKLLSEATYRVWLSM